MTLRVERNMKIEGIKWELDLNEETKDGKINELTANGECLLTPAGNRVAHEDFRLLNHIKAELRCLKILEPKLNLLWLFCSAVDHGDEISSAFTEREVSTLLLSDPILARSSNPICASAQMDDWTELSVYLSEREIQYPDFQSARISAQMQLKNSEEATNNFQRLTKLLTKEIQALSVAQKTIIANATNCYQSFTWAYFLSVNRLTPLEFATGIAASQNALPWAFSDISTDEHADGIKAMMLDGLMMQTFAEMF